MITVLYLKGNQKMMLLDEILDHLKQNTGVAYKDRDMIYSYSWLGCYTGKIYAYLMEQGDKVKHVLIYGHKEVDMLACFLACAFAGKTYVPIDAYTPDGRVGDILDALHPELIFAIAPLNERALPAETVAENICIVCPNVLREKQNMLSVGDIEIKMRPQDIFYMIFTSGSTGKPKGVQVSYANLQSFMVWFKELTKHTKGSVLNQAAFSFDLSVADIYLSLVTGSTLVVMPKSVQRDFCEMFQCLKGSNADIAVMTPSFAELLMLDRSFRKELMPKLSCIYFCGERLNVKTVRKLFKRFPGIRIINSYGPTECTVAVTGIDITEEMLISELLPVGCVKQDTYINIVNDAMEAMPDRCNGEILIVGASVACGYFGLPEKTAERFVDYHGEKAYRTGDIGMKKDDIIYCLGRVDSQIKYKGYRIELDDIEANINKIQDVQENVVVAEVDAQGNTLRIHSFVRLKQDSELSMMDIRDMLAQYLPDYMCPNIILVEKMPLNNNGKCDRQKLKEYINGR